MGDQGSSSLFWSITESSDTVCKGQIARRPEVLLRCIVAKKWDPGILDPSRFSAKIRKVEARLGKLAKIRKVETN